MVQKVVKLFPVTIHAFRTYEAKNVPRLDGESQVKMTQQAVDNGELIACWDCLALPGAQWVDGRWVCDTHNRTSL
jgi:hypothetical protein